MSFCIVKFKYRGLFKTHKSVNKTISGEIGINIKTSPKVGHDRDPEEYKCKRLLLACRTCFKCSMETSREWVNKSNYLYSFYFCPFDYTSVVTIVKARYLNLRLTTPVGLMLSLKL